MIKKLLFCCVFLLTLSMMKAQMVNGNAYMIGTGVEIGIDSAGGFEGVDTTNAFPLPGMHYRSNTPYFGFVANPQNNAWATFDGDYFTPGTPENGWGFEIGTSGGSNGANNCNVWTGPMSLGSVTNWSHVGTAYSVDWEGDAISGTNLHFKINYLLQETDLFYITTITITNNTTDTIPDLYYYRNLDPDNNIILTGNYTTQNTIISQAAPGCGTCVAHVKAEQSTPWYSVFAFLAIDTNFRAGYGGFTNRDGSDLYNGVGFTQTVGSTNLMDEAIYLAYRVQNFLPGDSATFKFCSIFDTTSVDCAMTALSTTLITPNTVLNTTLAFTLTGGSPAGGTYAGTGVVGGNMFDPSVSGVGTFTILYTYTDSAGCTANASSTIHVDLAAGVSEQAITNPVTVYPNPFSNAATISIVKDIKLSNADFYLYDIVGKQVMMINNIHSNEIKIDAKDLAPGVYFYKLNNNGKLLSSGKVMMK
jgi:hypothetical protein